MGIPKKIRYSLFTIGGILVAATAFFLYYSSVNTTGCPAFNEGYYDWLPYTEKQELVFTDGKSDRIFTVSAVDVHHTSRYNHNAKCGCCEDQVRVVMTSAGETLEVIYDNYDNPDNCFGEMVRVNFTKGYAEAQNPGISASDEKFDVENRVFFKKSEGIIQFIALGKTWSLKSSGPTDKKRHIGNGSGC